MADSVLQATVVLPNGQVVTASPSSEPDLFWVSWVAISLQLLYECTQLFSSRHTVSVYT
jgi:hypothetical protein